MAKHYITLEFRNGEREREKKKKKHNIYTKTQSEHTFKVFMAFLLHEVDKDVI